MNGSDARNFVVFEPETGGHQREWLEYLASFAEEFNEPLVLWLVMAPKLHREMSLARPFHRSERVRMLALTPSEHALCSHRRLAISGFARWWIMRRYLARTKAEAGHFLSLDHLSLPLGLGFGARKRRLCGILFRPSVHYRGEGGRSSLSERWRDIRKEILYRRMLSNPALVGVLSLDPYFPAYARDHYAKGHKVRTIPDPVHHVVDYSEADAALANRIPENRVKFLLFGYLTRRKGILALLDCLFDLPETCRPNVAIMLAGVIEDDIRADVLRCLSHLRALRPDIWIGIEDRTLTMGEIEALVRTSDVVLLPYQRFVGSSGVLMWAARAGKPVISQDSGLLRRLVDDHRLGRTVNATQRAALAKAIAQMATEGPERFIDREAARAFIADRTPRRFAATVFSNLLGLSVEAQSL